MVNASNGYAGGEPDLAIPVARSPQIRARLGTSLLQTPALRGQIPTERQGEPKSKADQGFGIDCNQDMIRPRGGRRPWPRLRARRLRSEIRSCCRSATAAGR